MNEEEFRNLAKEKGYGEVEFQKVGPGPEEEMHAHEHSVLSLILSGKAHFYLQRNLVEISH